MSALSETIAAQGQLLGQTLGIDLEEAVNQLRDVRRLWLVGTGTSQHAAELGARMLDGDRETHWSSAASFARFGPQLGKEDGVIVISHTTETAFARLARSQALSVGSRVISITAQGTNWPEAIQTTPHEQSETYTASYTAALLVLARLAVALGTEAFTESDIATLPERAHAAAQVGDPIITTAPERLLVVAGVGPGAITAREGALKLREAARIPAEGYEVEYLLHGSAVPLDRRDALVLVQPNDDPDGLAAEVGAAAHAEGVAVSTVDDPGHLHPILMQVPLIVRLQALASYFADKRGMDPDVAIRSAWESDALWEAGAPEEG